MSTAIRPFVMIVVEGQRGGHDVLFFGVFKTCFVIVMPNAEPIGWDQSSARVRHAGGFPYR